MGSGVPGPTELLGQVGRCQCPRSGACRTAVKVVSSASRNTNDLRAVAQRSSQCADNMLFSMICVLLCLILSQDTT